MPVPMIILLLALACIFCFFAVIFIRTLCFRPRPETAFEREEIQLDKSKAVENLRALIRCQTVSHRDRRLENEAEFQKLYEALPRLFPHVYEKCRLTELPDRAVLFHWSGLSEGEPAVFMAHYDVVPADADGWEKPPFDAVLEDGVLWGRGTLDTKVTFSGILSAVDQLIAEGFTPQHDIYLAFSGGEEVNGQGAIHIVDYFDERGIQPSFVLDEGGAVVEDAFPGVTRPCALIGIAEKGILELEYRVRSNGGHASAPKPHTPVGILSQACVDVERKRFPFRMTRPVSEMLDTLGRHSSFSYRMIFANLWCFSWVLDLLCKKKGGELNALLRTTVAFTQMSGSAASNVIPPEATMVSNIRLLPQDTVEHAKARIKRAIKNEAVSLHTIHGINPSRISRTDCDGYRKIGAAISGTWQGSVVSPYLMVQCSDSRHYGRISDRVYRFSAMELTSEERRGIHGNNERIRTETVCRSVEFFLRLMKTL